MNIFKLVQEVKSRIITINGIELNESINNEKINVKVLSEIENRMGIEFPASLREMYISFSSEVSISWSVEDNIFGRKCSSGRLNILSPQKIENIYDDMKFMVIKLTDNKGKIDGNVGMQELIHDWPFWIPVISFPNGDAFCIDKRNDDKPIVFLEHDVIDSESDLHGLKIAENFETLMNNWSKINFVDIFDWSLGVNEKGIDLSKAIFDKLLGRTS